MPKELIDRYNHLRYSDQTSEVKGFVDFLYDNTENSAPEVDVDTAWNSFHRRLERKSTKSNPWMRIAASVVVLIGVSIFIWSTSTSPDQVNIATLDEKINVTFPDGSTGILNSNSSFSFLEEFGNERLVSFNGEAFFDIKKSKKPFIIDVGGVEVRVLGTAFNLVSSVKEVELYVERGLVAFDKDGEQTKVPAGLKAVFTKSNGEVVISEDPSPNITSWSNGKLDFNETIFSQVIEDLETYYGVEFEIANEQINTCNLTASFEKNSLSDVIKTIEAILEIKMTQTGKIVQVSGFGC